MRDHRKKKAWKGPRRMSNARACFNPVLTENTMALSYQNLGGNTRLPILQTFKTSLLVSYYFVIAQFFMWYPTYICNDRVNLLVVYSMYLNLSFFTGSSSAIYERGTNAFFLERASLLSLPFEIDDRPQGVKRKWHQWLDSWSLSRRENCQPPVRGHFCWSQCHLWPATLAFAPKQGTYIISRQLAPTFVFHIFNLTGVHLFYLNTFSIFCRQ